MRPPRLYPVTEKRVTFLPSFSNFLTSSVIWRRVGIAKTYDLAQVACSKAHLFSYPLASPVDPIIRRIVFVGLRDEYVQLLATGALLRLGVAAALLHDPAHFREVDRVAPHAVN